MNLHPGDALLLVDIQNDFLPGGSLAVPQGNQVVPVANRYLTLFQTYHLPVFATRDWHPPLHCSFQSQGGPWPPHCVAGTAGAGFPTGLHLSADTRIVSKATTPERDAYSGFSGTELDRLLKEAEIRRLFVVGLATDYCVLNTVKDALALGYSVCLLTDAIRAVENHPGDGERAIAEMRGLGAVLLDFQALQE
ncbi:MAG TPA: nicotinamidase [Methylococcaceae bacterium]|jgi:nicotinamidase/pyrazinamidase|nr:nicotinamidase [Methylococcaceae bacterium]